MKHLFYCPSQAILSSGNALSFSLFNSSGKCVVISMSFKIRFGFKFYFEWFQTLNKAVCKEKNLPQFHRYKLCIKNTGYQPFHSENTHRLQWSALRLNCCLLVD